MEKEFSYNQFIVGLLLQFGSIDFDDVKLLIDMLDIKNFSKSDDSSMRKFIKLLDNGRIIFDNEVIGTVYNDVNDFYLMAENYQGNIVLNYLENIDEFEFVLRKIKLLDNMMKEDFYNFLSIHQVGIVNELYRNGYLINSFRKSDTDEIYKEISLTKRGELYLYLIDNKDKIKNFSCKFRKLGYDELLIQPFLITQDLDENPDDILQVDNFLDFCDIFNKYPMALEVDNDSKRIGYSRKRSL